MITFLAVLFCALLLLSMLWNLHTETQWAAAVAEKEEAELKARGLHTALAESASLRAVIRGIEAENRALAADYESAVRALTECKGYVLEKQKARLDELVHSFVDRREEEIVRQEIDSIIGVTKPKGGR